MPGRRRRWFSGKAREDGAIEELSKAACGFINYEYMVNLSRRVPKVYKKKGKVVQVLGGLLNA